MTSERIEDALCLASDRSIRVSQWRMWAGRPLEESTRASIRAGGLTVAFLRRLGLAVSAGSGPVAVERRVLN